MTDRKEMNQLRAFGDITYVRNRLRTVIKRGYAILDQLEGGRQYTEPDTNITMDQLFGGPFYEGQRALGFWRKSIHRLIAVHLPSLKDEFKQPVPEPDSDLSSIENLDSLDAYIRSTVKELEAILESLTNDSPSKSPNL